MIINSDNLTYEKKTNNKKIINAKSNNNLNKINDIASKTFEKTKINKFKKNEPRHLNISGKILSNNLKDFYPKNKKESNTINNNYRYNPIFKRSRYIHENNFNLNPLSLLNINKSSTNNKIGHKNNSDMNIINTMTRLKNVIRPNNNIIARKASRNYMKNINKYNSKTNIKSRGNQFNTSINISYIYKSKIYKSINKQLEEHLYTLNNSYK